MSMNRKVKKKLINKWIRGPRTHLSSKQQTGEIFKNH